MSKPSVAGRDRPLTLIIGALGGEGGGLLADWIVEAAKAEGVLVQSTSIPGVAQRTGATTYYLEMMKPRRKAAAEPVFALYPAPGHLDLVVASELVEAGRALEMGWVTSERTTLISPTHRVMTIEEKSAMGEVHVDEARIVTAADMLAGRAILRDFQALALDTGTQLNAVLLGAVAATGLCPMGEAAFEKAIQAGGIAVAGNLAGFRAGLALARGDIEAPARPREQRQTPGASAADALVARARAELPGECLDFAEEGVRRLVGYQDAVYAALYLDRLAGVLAADRASGGAGKGFALTRETARHLALRMAYEDVIRVADLKSRADRTARLRREVGAKDGEPVRVTEFLKPGIEELATVLPARLGRALTMWAERRGMTRRLHVPMHLRSDTVSGYLRLRLLASLKRLRRGGFRYAQEQEAIEHWLDSVQRAAPIDRALALEIVECARLIKGYSDTRARALANYAAIDRALIAPALSGGVAAEQAATWIAEAREAALADEEGRALAAFFAQARRPAAPDAKAAEGAKIRKSAETPQEFRRSETPRRPLADY
jgi:indolepyruvate ferredoxin oxidoreductase beta subunit